MNAFDVIENKLGEYFSGLNFSKKKLGELSTVFCNDEKTYKLEYLTDKNQFKLLYANNKLERLKDEDFKEISVWLFDPKEDTEKEAKSIANDFIESLNVTKKKLNVRKSSKNDGQGTNDLMFFINRLATVFPELKDDIKYEKENYSSFRGINFCREKALPLVVSLLRENTQKDKIKKLCNLFNNSYEDGDLDVRSSITMIFLNAIEDESSKEVLKSGLNKDLNLAWKAALKYKGKKVKPEKVKKKVNFFDMAQKSLNKEI